MFVGFNLKMSSSFFQNSLKKSGEQIFEENKSQIKNGFSNLVQEVNLRDLIEIDDIDGTKIQNLWFPQIRADVFISHSHKDKDIALELAGWLKETFGLEAFIDSCVWGYVDELLKKIDDKYCKTEDGKYYDYYLRNKSTSHVHMMLANALSMMLDKTECVFFLNTPNSIRVSDIKSSTPSPWIYFEIIMTSLIERKIPKRDIFSKYFEKKAFPNIFYNVSLTHLIELNQSDLDSWENKWKSIQKEPSYSLYPPSKIIHPLDELYKIKGIIQKITIME